MILKKIFNPRSLSAFLVFFAAGSVFTYPLLFRFKTFVPYFFSSDEIFGIIRQFWWYKLCFLKHIAYTADYMMAVPFGFTHAKIFVWPLWEVAGRFLTITFLNEILAYNIVIYTSFILSALFTYYLVYYLTKNQLSSIFSGLIFAFCPYYFVRSWQHFGLVQIQWLPLCLLAIFRLRNKQGIASCIFLALVLSLGVATDYQYSFFMYIMTMFFIFFVLLFDRVKRRLIGLLFLAIFLSFIISIPAMYPMLKGIFGAHSAQASAYNPYLRPFDDLFAQSARPLSYFLPAVVHPLFGDFTGQFLGSQLYGESVTEHTLYLGWIPLILAFFAFLRWKKTRKTQKTGENFFLGFLIFLVVASWFYSQPPWWQIGPLKIYMPSFFTYKIVPMFRAYCRFGIVLMLVIAVLAGFGLRFILERFRNNLIKAVLTTILCGLVLFEFWNWPPYKVLDVSKAPAVYYWLKAKPEDFVIAEYPLDHITPNEMYKFYQTVHEKRIINGSFPGTPANDFAQKIIKLSGFGTAGLLKGLGVDYVLVHKEKYLSTDLIDDKEEFAKISVNKGLKLIKSFPQEECPRNGVSCVRSAGQIDVYEITADAIDPKL